MFVAIPQLVLLLHSCNCRRNSRGVFLGSAGRFRRHCSGCGGAAGGVSFTCTAEPEAPSGWRSPGGRRYEPSRRRSGQWCGLCSRQHRGRRAGQVRRLGGGWLRGVHSGLECGRRCGLSSWDLRRQVSGDSGRCSCGLLAWFTCA